MIDSAKIRLARTGGFVLACLLLGGCGDDGATGTVKGKVTVNGEIPMDGSSINFVSSDGKSQSAGDTLKQGNYSATVPVGTCKVEIRVPRPQTRAKPGPKSGGPGPGPGAGGIIEESLPAEYNDKTTLTLDVKPGSNEKNWDIQTKTK